MYTVERKQLPNADNVIDLRMHSALCLTTSWQEGEKKKNRKRVVIRSVKIAHNDDAFRESLAIIATDKKTITQVDNRLNA